MRNNKLLAMSSLVATIIVAASCQKSEDSGPTQPPPGDWIIIFQDSSAQQFTFSQDYFLIRLTRLDGMLLARSDEACRRNKEANEI